MALVDDASASPQKTLPICYSKNRINQKHLKELIRDLDVEDIISIIFLFTNTETNVSEIIQILNDDPCAAFFKLTHEKDWPEKLLECLVITGNINNILRLGYSKTEVDTMKIEFLFNVHNVSPNLNRVIKSLYFLCKELNHMETKKLIDEVNKNLLSPVRLNNLEIIILHWIRIKFISIDKNFPNLENLIKHLKITGNLSAFSVDFNFESWKTEICSSSIQQDHQKSDSKNSLQTQNGFRKKSVTKIPWDEDHNKLLIVINNYEFYKGRFKDKPRHGSQRDVENLIETFKGCGFDTDLYNNITEDLMMILLDEFSDDIKYKKYRSIFVCILSHGYKGVVIFPDDKIISIETIKNKFCCKNFQNVFKCLIVQACQGVKPGVIDKTDENIEKLSKLVSDGPSDNPLYFKYFLLFQATIFDFLAWRHEKEGTWFIQDLCNVIREKAPIDVLNWTQEVTDRVSSRRGNTRSKNLEYVQVPLVQTSSTGYYVIPAYKNQNVSK